MNNENDFFNKDKEFGDLVKKARRASSRKTIIISITISFIVFFGLYYAGAWLMQWKIDSESRSDSAWHQIVGANIELTGTSYNYSPFTATGSSDLQKIVGGVPIPWGKHEKLFTLLGTSKRISTNGPSGSASNDDERMPLYFEGQRVIEFYHPEVFYRNKFDDRNLLGKMEPNTVVEMAFSFDQSYTIEEVEDLFGEHLAWYWVDTFTEEEIQDHTELNQSNDMFFDHTIVGDGAYGFMHRMNKGENISAQSFISMLDILQEEGGDYEQTINHLVDIFTVQGTKELTAENLPIIGVVVTGLGNELEQYNDIPKIEGATLGAVTRRYTNE